MNRLARTLPIVLPLALLALPAGLAAQEHAHAAHRAQAAPAAGLVEPGNGAFAAIQEVVARLEADPETDWTRVDLESLRQHLVDMDAMTRGVQVLEQRPVEGGVELRVRPLHDGAAESLRRVLAAHPGPLAAERGWRMSSREEGGSFVVRVTSGDDADVDRIRGLGYIGVMSLGGHHTEHHWMIATGRHPHAHR